MLQGLLLQSRVPMLTILASLCAAGVPVPAAAADIYKCTDENGAVAYLQLPCPVKKDPDSAAIPDAAVEDPEPPPVPTPSSRLEDEALADCKKRYRDQIDAIDAELSSSWSPDEAADYKERLRALTQQLRACG